MEGSKKKWQEELLLGVEEIPMVQCVPGTINVYGTNTHPIISDENNGVFLAAATYGKGRIIVFSHDRFVQVERFTTHISDKNLANLYLNIKKWLSFGIKQSDKIVIRDCVHEGEFNMNEILVGTGLVEVSPQYVERLRDFVHSGGRMVIGETPWGFLQLRPEHTLATMPMNCLIKHMGMAYTEDYLHVEPIFKVLRHCDLQTEIITICTSFPQNIKGSDTEWKRICSKLLRLSKSDVYAVKDHILKAINGFSNQIHCHPTPHKPVAQPEGKVLVCLIDIASRFLQPLEGWVKIPVSHIFPGDWERLPLLESGKVRIEPPEHGQICFHATGWYVAPGVELEMKVKEPMSDWMWAIGAHSDRLWRVDEPWRRWPHVQMKETLAGSTEFKVTSPTGGLLYFVSNGAKAPLHVKIFNAIKTPYYDIGNDQLKKNWELQKHLLAPWVDLIGEKIQFTVPSKSVKEIPDPEALLRFWDEVVEAHYDLCGWKDESFRRRQWVVCDEQPSVGYMHAGYPVVTGLDVAQFSFMNRVDASLLNLSNLIHRGSWGMFHELGHNVQNSLWTFEGTVEVTCNIFTLHAMEKLCGIKPWIHHWLQQNIPGMKKYLHDGANFQEWQQNPYVGLFIYAQLARDFGWSAYKKVFAAYQTLSGSELPRSESDKIHCWIVQFSTQVSRNLCPLFSFWGFPVEERTKMMLKKFKCHLPDDEATQTVPKRVNMIKEQYNM